MSPAMGYGLQGQGQVPALLLIDTNMLGIGAMRQYRDLSHGGMATGAILGIVEKLVELVASHPGHVPIALWDDRCRWREALLPRYKRHRWETPEQVAFLESYLRHVEIVREVLRYVGFAYSWGKVQACGRRHQPILPPSRLQSAKSGAAICQARFAADRLLIRHDEAVRRGGAGMPLGGILALRRRLRR